MSNDSPARKSLKFAINHPIQYAVAVFNTTGPLINLVGVTGIANFEQSIVMTASNILVYLEQIEESHAAPTVERRAISYLEQVIKVAVTNNGVVNGTFTYPSPPKEVELTQKSLL